jgi:hypothetical protein
MLPDLSSLLLVSQAVYKLVSLTGVASAKINLLPLFITYEISKNCV